MACRVGVYCTNIHSSAPNGLVSLLLAAALCGAINQPRTKHQFMFLELIERATVTVTLGQSIENEFVTLRLDGGVDWLA